MRMCIQSSRPKTGSTITKFENLYVHTFDTGVPKVGRHLHQTSKPPASKLRPNFDQTSTKLRSNFDTPSVEVWSKFARYTHGIHCEFERMSTKLRHQTTTPNFEPPVSKFGRNSDQTST